jgi:hypothetical protein
VFIGLYDDDEAPVVAVLSEPGWDFFLFATKSDSKRLSNAD